MNDVDSALLVPFVPQHATMLQWLDVDHRSQQGPTLSSVQLYGVSHSCCIHIVDVIVWRLRTTTGETLRLKLPRVFSPPINEPTTLLIMNTSEQDEPRHIRFPATNPTNCVSETRFRQ